MFALVLKDTILSASQVPTITAGTTDVIAPSITAPPPTTLMVAAITLPAASANYDVAEGTAITQAMVGDGPYYLSSSDTTYYLDENITVGGAGLAIIASGVELNLNGYTLTYDNDAAPTVTNGGFETGSGQTATGWDFTNAPNAVIYAPVDPAAEWLENHLYEGSQSLKMAVTTSNEYVESSGTVTLAASTRYAISGMVAYGGGNVANPTGVTTYVRLMDGETVVASAERTEYNTRGIQLVEAEFTTPGSPPSYKIRCGVVGKAGSAQASYIDDVKIVRSKCYGITTQIYSWSSSRYYNYDYATQNGAGTNAIVRNGTITQGQGGGSFAHGIYSHAVSGIVIDSVTVNVNGQNCSCILGDTMANRQSTITSNTLTSTVTTITSRDSNNGGVLLNHQGEISYNVIRGGPHVGLRTNQSSSQIHHNSVRLKNRYTNGFGIMVTADDEGGLNSGGSDCYSNTIDYVEADEAGSGLFLSGRNTRAYNNTINVRLFANNQEYGGAQNNGVYGIQIESGDDMEVYGNTVTVTADETEAHAMRIGGSTLHASTGDNVHDNTFIAVTNSSERASCFRLSRFWDTDSIILKDNTCQSNSHFLGTSSYMVNDVMQGNSLEVTGSPVDFWVCEVWNYDPASTLEIVNLIFLDPVYANARAQTEFEAQTPVKYVTKADDDESDYKIKWTTTVHVQNAGAVAQAGAAVTIENSSAATVASGTTDANGNYSVAVMESYHNNGTVVNYNNHTAEATKDATSGSQSFTADSVQTVTVTVS